MKKVLIFELNNYHTETFPIYEKLLPTLLHDEIDVEYFVMQKRYDDTAAIYKKVHLLFGKWIFFFAKHLQFRVPFFIYRINRIIKEMSPDLVVFNTIEPERYYRIFKKIIAPKKLGLIHNPKKNTVSKKTNEYYFVLSKILFENFKKSIPLDGYLLPYFRQFDFPVRGNNERLVIAVQGLVSFKRRDYPFLIEAAREMQKRGVSDVVFNIIGSRHIRDAEAFLKMVQDGGVERYFLFYDELDDRAFFEQINDSDCIMTLLHQNQSHYYREKTTASCSHAAAYAKLLVLSKENADAWGVGSDMAIVYDGLESFVDTILTMRSSQDRITETFRRFIEQSIEENKIELSKLGIMRAEKN